MSDEQPDDLSRRGVSDPPLSLERRTPGPRGLAGKLLLAALGLLVLFAMVAVVLIAHHYSPPAALHRSASEIRQR